MFLGTQGERDMSSELTCEWCGGEVGFRIFRETTDTTPTFCTAVHMNLWLTRQVERARNCGYPKEMSK